MKYWIVWYDGTIQSYKLKNANEVKELFGNDLAVFKSFDMAYEYVTRMNGNNTMNAISKWANR